MSHASMNYQLKVQQVTHCRTLATLNAWLLPAIRCGLPELLEEFAHVRRIPAKVLPLE